MGVVYVCVHVLVHMVVFQAHDVCIHEHVHSHCQRLVHMVHCHQCIYITKPPLVVELFAGVTTREGRVWGRERESLVSLLELLILLHM